MLGSAIPRPCLQLLELWSILVGLEPRAVFMLGKYFITEQKLVVPLFFTGPYYVAQASPKPMIFLPQSLECQDNRYAWPGLT